MRPGRGMVETITAAASPALEHIIERPRLIARLAEGGGSRVSVLAAPAGYGKTTLARQWSKRQTGPVAWYRTTRASGDIALLAVQLDDLLASVAPDLPREPGRVASIASVNASPKPLAAAILQTFKPLTGHVLLVVDEWEAAATDEAEEFLSILVEGLDIRFLITTRTRPEWFTPRLEVYGEGLEIGVDELAMTDGEATRVLAAVGAVAGRARLMRTADGWPAVLGLAAMSGDVDFTSSHLLSHTLYDFLASELLAAASAETQGALMVLAVASIADVEVARTVLGPGADKLLEDALACGLIAVTDRKALSLHPLLRELLIQRFGDADADARQALLSRCRNLFEAQRWDEALSVAEIARDGFFATEAIAAALDDLLAAGRTSSLQRWVTAARSAGAVGGLIDYAESEALFRGGELDRALALATHAAGSLEGDLIARAHLVAGRSAHLLDRPDRTGRHADLAAASAETTETREGARWLRYLRAIEQEAPDLTERLEEFRAVAQSGLTQSLMVAAAELGEALVEGGLPNALDDARDVLALARRGADPIAHTSFLSVYSGALLINGRYEEALEHLDALTTLAVSNAIDFAVPYAAIQRAKALIGIRKFALATRTLLLLERQMQDEPGGYFHGRIQTERARLYASVGDLERAMGVLSLGPPPRLRRTDESGFLGWQALLSAVAGAPDRAKAQIGDARRTGRGLEAESLTLVAGAVIALGDGKRDETAARLRTVIEAGVYDPIVIASRAAPTLGAFIASQSQWRSWFQRLLIHSRDASLAASLGLRVPRGARAPTGLSPRETEVHELIAQGLTNEEIAKLLHISLSTTKVHAKHIFEKLGVRSRLEAARALGDGV
jgi:LuxR family transcriptional regulator, maltose regulon positive regulatory protein